MLAQERQDVKRSPIDQLPIPPPCSTIAVLSRTSTLRLNKLRSSGLITLLFAFPSSLSPVVLRVSVPEAALELPGLEEVETLSAGLR